MNFYKHHIGDYSSRTAQLTLVEHGAYLLMLQHHYATELPLPLEVATIGRIIRATAKIELEAIKAVLDAYWTRTADGYVQKRAQEEIEKASAQRDTNRVVGKKGGRPKTKSVTDDPPDRGPDRPPDKTESETEQETESVLKSETESVTESVLKQKPNDNPSQTPDSRHQTKPKERATTGSTTVEPEPGVTLAGLVCARLRSAGVSGCNPSHPRLLAVLEAGATLDEFADVAAEQQAKGKGMAWVVATVEGRRRDAAAVKTQVLQGDFRGSKRQQQVETIAALTGRSSASGRTGATIDVVANRVD